jgi:hypothetical protein
VPSPNLIRIGGGREKNYDYFSGKQGKKSKGRQKEKLI